MKIDIQLLPDYPAPYFHVNIMKYGSGTIQKIPDKAFYGSGEPVQVICTPSPGWNFTTWRKDSTSTNPIINLIVNSEINLVARLKKPLTKRVIISDLLLAHATDVKAAFEAAYFDYTGNVFPDVIEIIIGEPWAEFPTADALGAEIFIRSTNGAQLGGDNIAQNYYPLNVFWCSGSNNPLEHKYITSPLGNLPSLFLTGYGLINNLTSYEIEAYSDNPILAAASFSNGYIAGLMAAAVDTHYNNAGYKDYFAARYLFRKGKIYNLLNGFGKIDAAILQTPALIAEYQANVALDPDFYRNLDPYLLR